MALGELLFPLGYAPLHPTTGATLPGGKLRFHRTGTTTDQDTYSDSALNTANANPVVLNAAGVLETKIYGDPGTGFNYRYRLYDSSDNLLSTFDDVVVPSRDVATITEGSFTGTLTGYASGPTGTVKYRIVADDEGTGKLCSLRIADDILGTSNTTALTMTGLPAAVVPTDEVWLPTNVRDNGTSVPGAAFIDAATSTIEFYTDSPFSATGFTNSGTKGLSRGWQITYAL